MLGTTLCTLLAIYMQIILNFHNTMYLLRKYNKFLEEHQMNHGRLSGENAEEAESAVLSVPW